MRGMYRSRSPRWRRAVTGFTVICWPIVGAAAVLAASPASLHRTVDLLSPALYRPVSDTASAQYVLRPDAIQPGVLHIEEAGKATLLPADTTGPGIAGTTVDSNADSNGNVSIQTGAPGYNDHRFDIGIFPSPAFAAFGDSPYATFAVSLAFAGLGTGFSLKRRATGSAPRRTAGWSL